jgi:LacI family gluconate utilization system Gnt-I transcriptional repressor
VSPSASTSPVVAGAGWPSSAATTAAPRNACRAFAKPRGAVAGAMLLAEAPDADAVFAANDTYAIAFLSALRRAGRLVPGPASAQPVAVVGLGDLEMGRLFAPAVSTIRVHGTAIGRAAAELALDPTKPRRVDLGFELVVRESG